MMEPDVQLALIQAIAALPPTALLTVAIVGLVRGDVVTKRHHEEVCAEKDDQIYWLQTQVDRLQNGEQTRFNLDKSSSPAAREP